MQLIIINGPCGIGKSTAAAALHAELPLSFLLDIDAQARFINHYKEYPAERWELVTTISKGIIKNCLEIGRDVIIDKMIYDTDLLNAYRALGKQANASVYEFILWAPKEVVMARAHARGWAKGGLLTPEKCERFWEEIDHLKRRRPEATVIDVSELTEREILDELKNRLSKTSPAVRI